MKYREQSRRLHNEECLMEFHPIVELEVWQTIVEDLAGGMWGVEPSWMWSAVGHMAYGHSGILLGELVQVCTATRAVAWSLRL